MEYYLPKQVGYEYSYHNQMPHQNIPNYQMHPVHSLPDLPSRNEFTIAESFGNDFDGIQTDSRSRFCNTSNVIQPKVRYSEVPWSDSLFESQHKRKYEETRLPRKRGRPPLYGSRYCSKRPRIAERSKSHGPFMQMLAEDDMEQDTLSQAISDAGIGSAIKQESSTSINSVQINKDDKITKTPDGKGILKWVDGKPVLPPEYKIYEISVTKTDDGFQVSAPTTISLSDDDINDVIKAATTGEIIFKPNKGLVPTAVSSELSISPSCTYESGSMCSSVSCVTGSDSSVNYTGQDASARSSMDSINNEPEEKQDSSKSTVEEVSLDGYEIKRSESDINNNEFSNTVIALVQESAKMNNNFGSFLPKEQSIAKSCRKQLDLNSCICEVEESAVPSVASVSVISSSDDNAVYLPIS